MAISHLSQLAWTLLFTVLLENTARAQIEFEKSPIHYSTSEPSNPITELIRKIDSKAVELNYTDERGYLDSLLEVLEISTASQTLVFSKTSRQRRFISPESPRALFFNEDVYVGWIPEGEIIEISVADPQLGAVFYTIDQKQLTNPPKITRQFGQCLLCHASTHTDRIPGHIVRSVHTDRTGMPMLQSVAYRTTDRSPLSERWGGWYVTGTHGEQKHMGNLWSEDSHSWLPTDEESGANLIDLSKKFDPSLYPTSHSDLVALMVLEHQITMHNLITAANIEWRIYCEELKSQETQQENSDSGLSEESNYRLNLLASRIVEGLLFKQEARLLSPVKGTSPFQDDFESKPPFDSQGRSLHQFDLTHRLFKYPCSYLIYSESFNALPEDLLNAVFHQLKLTLNASKDNDNYQIPIPERQAIWSILKETSQNLPHTWQHHFNPKP
ncbi:hypothetical protein [Rubinisphaera italica]|uniref:Cytochrome c domain-containing protein n=1 Tax=Rubinisphaera italica TaxID=2527969 RepID=A0A5C5X8S6_9PLAN|nr:hypothetical protein [Rubinisphaera italica]TWT59340.1 hypothetical protein Pan54_00410 [Rubinisphaera italica]